MTHANMLPSVVWDAAVKRSSACATGLRPTTKAAAASILRIEYIALLLRCLGRPAPGPDRRWICLVGVRSERTMFVRAGPRAGRKPSAIAWLCIAPPDGVRPDAARTDAQARPGPHRSLRTEPNE